MDFGGRNVDGAGFQIAPLIDIVFLLLIWLLATYAMAEEERSLVVNLPPAESAEARPRVLNDIVVNVGPDGTLAVDRRVFTPAALEERLRLLADYARADAEGREPGVIIRADGQTPHRYVAEVLDICGRAGVRRVFFAAVAPREP